MEIPTTNINTESTSSGLREGTGSHSSRTLMLSELELLFAANTTNAGAAENARLIIDANVLQKTSESSRRKTAKFLGSLYGLDPRMPVYATLRQLWDRADDERPMLACLCANARDALLRATTPLVLEVPAGTPVTYYELSDAVERAFPGKYTANSLKSIGQNALSSWTQSGHLHGIKHRRRGQAVSGPVSTTYALLLGHLCGARGAALFDTFWTALLDSPRSAVEEYAVEAGRQGLLEYRHAGDVVDISFNLLLPQKE